MINNGEDFPGIVAPNEAIRLAYHNHLMAVKGSMNTIQSDQDYQHNLENYVNIVNDTTRHAYYLLKFTFLREFQIDDFDTHIEYLNKDFFAEVLLSLVALVGGSRTSAATNLIRELIGRDICEYMYAANYHLPAMLYAQQSSHYEGFKMLICYFNNIKLTFGVHI